jgi:hypothetical protein
MPVTKEVGDDQIGSLDINLIIGTRGWDHRWHRHHVGLGFETAAATVTARQVYANCDGYSCWGVSDRSGWTAVPSCH